MKTMDGMNIEIRIDNPKDVYTPGQHLSGSIVLQNRENWEAITADVLLGWRTMGRGDQDSAAVQTIALFMKGEVASPRVEKRFSFRIPKMPWTYHGQHIKLDWLIGVYIKGKGFKETSEEKSIVVQPERKPQQSPPQDLVG